MASRPDFTENADRPLSSDELAADRAASPQGTDPVDSPDNLADESESGDDFEDNGSIEDLADDEQDVVDTALTRLPPG